MSELSALYMTLGSLNLLGRGKLSVQFTGESMAVARRVYTLLQKGLELSPQIHYVSTAHFGGTRKCVLTLGPTQTPAFLSALGMMTIGENGEATLRSTSPKVNLNRSCCVRAFLRGAMLGGGTMTNPEQGYHLELGYRDENFRDCVAKCLQKVGLPEGQGFPLFEAVRPDRHLSDGSGRASGGDGDGESPGAAAGAQLGEPCHELRQRQFAKADERQ